MLYWNEETNSIEFGPMDADVAASIWFAARIVDDETELEVIFTPEGTEH